MDRPSIYTALELFKPYTTDALDEIYYYKAFSISLPCEASRNNLIINLIKTINPEEHDLINYIIRYYNGNTIHHKIAALNTLLSYYGLVITFIDNITYLKFTVNLLYDKQRYYAVCLFHGRPLKHSIVYDHIPKY